MRNALVTIVVPVYNAEKYLDRCMESLTHQTYTCVEIILVDDCSTDQSLKKCQEWGKKDARIRICTKTVNEGAGMARNTGMREAKGQYILFVDSDDYLALNAIEKSVFAAEKTKAQAVIFGHYDVDSRGQITGICNLRREETLFEGKQVQIELVPDLISPDPEKKDVSGTVHARAMMFEVKTLKLNKWQFVSERKVVSEDVYFLAEIYGLLNKVVVIPDAMYFYCENGTSITHSYGRGGYEKIEPFYWEMQNLSERIGYEQKVIPRIAMASLSFVIAAMESEMTLIHNGKKQRKRVREIIDDKWLQSMLKIVRRNRHNRNCNILLHVMRYKLYLICWVLVYCKRR